MSSLALSSPQQRFTFRFVGRAAKALLAAAVIVSTSCVPDPPPRWAEGGAVLALGQARFDRGENGSVEIFPDGSVLEEGELEFFIDRAGRVFDESRDPLAIMLEDGLVVGTNEHWLGRVGLSNASPPGQGYAWLSIQNNGDVIYFNADGERVFGGRWQGCQGELLRTCTFVTHLLVVQRARAQPQSTFSVGVGIGL